MKKVLVTGASGFLGSHISEALHEAGYEAHALIRETSSRQWLDHDWLTVHVCELDDRKILARILKGMDAVIHNAGALPGSSEAELRRANVESTRILAEEAIKAGVLGFVYVSSRSAGGVNTGGFLKTEDEPDSSTVGYGKSKKQAEEILYSLRRKIHAVSLRYALIYGPRDRHLLRLFKMVSGSIVPIPGFKPIYTPMVYVEDAARAAVAALQASVDSGSFYYISDEVEYTLDLIYDFIMRALGKSGVRVRVPLWVASVAAWWMNRVMRKETGLSPDLVSDLRSRYRLVSPKRAIRELGWRPEVTPEKGFAETAQWYRDQGWLK
jgi:nucleoside-diphosphate-sugar epimerase